MWKSGRHWFILVTVTNSTAELLVTNSVVSVNVHHFLVTRDCLQPGARAAQVGLWPCPHLTPWLFTGWSRVWQESSSPEALPLRPGTWRFLIPPEGCETPGTGSSLYSA